MPRDVEFHVYEADLTTFVDAIAGDTDPSFRKVRNGVGGGWVDLPVGHPDLGLLQDRRVVRCQVNGVDRYAWIVRGFDETPIADRAEEAGERLVRTGPGLESLLGSMLFYPELGIQRISPNDRWMNPASFDFDVSGWDPAEDLTEADSHPLPDDWPFEAAGAVQVWSRQPVTGGPSTPEQPVGKVWFVGEFTMANDGTIEIVHTADDGDRVFLDGDEFDAETRAFMWRVTKRRQVFLSAGTHRIAVEAENILRDSVATNRASFALAVLPVTDGGASLGAPLFESSSATLVTLDYPSPSPTMTPGQVVNIGIDENHARGRLTQITTDCTIADDSNGTPWAVPVDLVLSVGADHLLSLLESLAEQHIVDWRVTVTGVVQVYNYGTMGSASGVDLTRGVNIAASRVSGEAPVGDVALVQYGDGRWIEVANPYSSGDEEVYLELGTAASEDAAIRQAEGIFEKAGRGWRRMRIELPPSMIPFDAFDVADLVDVEDETLTQREATVESMTIGVTEVGQARCLVECEVLLS